MVRVGGEGSADAVRRLVWELVGGPESADWERVGAVHVAGTGGRVGEATWGRTG